jgi:hypothetical protein
MAAALPSSARYKFYESSSAHRTRSDDMPEAKPNWDFFLAHAGADLAAAEQLYVLLQPRAQVFLDNYCLLPGDDWDQELAVAQRGSRVTIVLVSARTELAYYEREEIAAAIDLARRDKQAHRVVPIYLDDSPAVQQNIPYGLRLKHGLMVSAAEGLTVVAEQLIGLLDRLKGGEIRTQKLMDSSRSALTKLTQSGGKERLAGLKEITGVFRPLLIVLLAILIISMLLIVFCFVSPAIEGKGIAMSVCGSIGALSMACLMIVFTKSINVARELAHDSGDAA